MAKQNIKLKRRSDEHTDDEQGGSLLKRMRASFLRGLAIIIPVAITIWVLWFIFQFIDGIASPLYRQIGLNIPGLGFVTAILLILLLGTFSRYIAVKFFFRTLERIFLNLPLARSVYSGVRELIHAFSPERKNRTFREVCLIEYPGEGLYSLAFITNEQEIVSEDGTSHFANVYIPLPPNPTSGVLTLVNKNRLIPISISVEEGLKLVLSAGIVTPADFKVEGSLKRQYDD